MEKVINEAQEQNPQSIREIFFLQDLDYSIHELISDPDFISLERRMSRSSIFSIVGRTHAETWHSSFIAWLLNPQGEHGLGYFPIKRICYAMRKKVSGQLKITGDVLEKENLKKILEELPDQEIIDTGEFYDCRIMPDCTNSDEDYAKEFVLPNKKRLDIAFSCMVKPFSSVSGKDHRRFFFVCENKIESKENNDQTDDYAEYLENKPCFPLYNKNGESNNRSKLHTQSTKACSARLFLTIRPEDKPKNPTFAVLSYAELMDDLLVPCSRHEQLSSMGKTLLSEYIHTLDRCAFAVSDTLRKYAGDVIKKHIQTIFAMLKVQLFCDKFIDNDTNDQKIVSAKLDWICRLIKNKSSYQIMIDNKKEACVNVGKELWKPSVTGNKNNNIQYAKHEIRLDGKTLKAYWEEYHEKVYKEKKLSYTRNVGEKYSSVFRLLFDYIKRYTTANDSFYANWERGDRIGGFIPPKFIHEQLILMGNEFYNDSKRWRDWSKFITTIKKFVRAEDKISEDNTEYIVAYLDNQKNGRKPEAKAKILLQKWPSFYACDETDPRLGNSGIAGTPATKAYIPDNTKPWSQCWYVKGNDGKTKFLEEFIAK